MSSLLRYFRNYLKESLLGPLFKLLEACFELIVPMIIAKIVDDIIPHSNQLGLVAMILCLVAFAVVGVIVALTAQYFSAKTAVGYTKELTVDLYQKILSLPKYSRNSLSGDTLLTRLTSDTLQIQTGINSFLRLFLRAPIVVFGSWVMASVISPSLSLYFLGMIIILFIIVTGVSILVNRYYAQIRKLLDRLVSTVRENMLGVRVIRAFGQKKRELTQFTTENQAYTLKQIQAGHWSAFLSPATFLVVNITLLLLIWNGTIQVQAGSLEQGGLVALTNYLSQILVELIKMVTVVSTLNQSYISAKRVQEIFTQTSEDPKAPLPVEESTDTKLVLTVDEMSFSYPQAAESALQGIHFAISKGEFLGIIGGTGSGKSSLVDLLMRMYSPQKGKVAVYREGKTPASIEEWRHQFALVPQQAQLFSGTVRSNLLLGTTDVSDQELWKALEIAQAVEFIREKEGLDTVVEAFGRNFSGGQRQRLTIARALVQPAPILILDDATSALDYLTESRLLTAIRQQFSEKVFIMISQRTNSIRHADQILVLDQGKQVGLGTHEDLLANNALYRAIDRSQHQQDKEEQA